MEHEEFKTKGELEMKRKDFLKMMAAGAALPLAGCYTAGHGMPKARNAHLNLEKVFVGAYYVQGLASYGSCGT